MKKFAGSIAVVVACTLFAGSWACSSGDGGTGGGSGGGAATGGGSVGGSGGSGGTGGSTGGGSSGGGAGGGSGGGSAGLPRGLLVYTAVSSGNQRVYVLGTGGASPTTPTAVTPDDPVNQANLPSFTKDGRILYVSVAGTAPAFTGGIRVINTDGTGDTLVFDCSGLEAGSFCKFPVQGNNDLVYFGHVSREVGGSSNNNKLRSVALTGGTATDVSTLRPGCNFQDIVMNNPRTNLVMRTNGISCSTPGFDVVPVGGTPTSPALLSGNAAVTFNGAGNKLVEGSWGGANYLTLDASNLDGSNRQLLGNYYVEPSFLLRFLPDDSYVIAGDATSRLKHFPLATMSATATEVPGQTAAVVDYFSWKPLP